jgi:hypothetical protein
VRLDGCNPGWLALVTGGTWQIVTPSRQSVSSRQEHPRQPPSRPVWRSLLERIALR